MTKCARFQVSAAYRFFSSRHDQGAGGIRDKVIEQKDSAMDKAKNFGNR